MGLRAVEFPSAEDFLKAYTPSGPACLVTDVRMPGMSGLDLQSELQRRSITLPVVVITAFARTPLTVRAMQSGAVTMLDKPCNADELWDAIRKALARDVAERARSERREELHRRVASLSPAERTVMHFVIEGTPNKTIASELDVSLRTVENRRHSVLQKMQAGSVAELVRMAIEAGLDS
jgi:FixJ family two-component response regulator